jgi:hypothetical protein
VGALIDGDGLLFRKHWPDAAKSPSSIIIKARRIELAFFMV